MCFPITDSVTSRDKDLALHPAPFPSAPFFLDGIVIPSGRRYTGLLSKLVGYAYMYSSTFMISAGSVVICFAVVGSRDTPALADLMPLPFLAPDLAGRAGDQIQEKRPTTRRNAPRINDGMSLSLPGSPFAPYRNPTTGVGFIGTYQFTRKMLGGFASWLVVRVWGNYSQLFFVPSSSLATLDLS